MHKSVFDYSINALNLVLDEGINFSVAIKNISFTKKLSLKDRNDVSAITGSALRHYYVFESFLNKKYPNLDNELLRLSMLYLANVLFAKRLENEPIVKLLKEEFSKKEVTFDEEFFLKVEPSQLIADDLDKNSFEYLSLRNNVPQWLIKMWCKQYGERIGKLLVKSLHKPEEFYCNVNECVINKENFLSKYNDFVDSGFTNNVKYTGKGSVKSTEAYKANDIFLFKCAEQVLFEKLEFDPLFGIAILGEEHSNIHLAIAAKESHLVKMDIVAPDNGAYYKYNNDLKKYDLQHVSLIKTSASLELSLSQPVKTLILQPKNSHYSSLQSNCDYFLKCDPELLDGYIENQKKQLDDASKLVIDGGQLVYLVHTVNKKETHFVVSDFLKNHPEYSLSFEKQFIPIDKYQSCLYFAILKKEVVND